MKGTDDGIRFRTKSRGRSRTVPPDADRTSFTVHRTREDRPAAADQGRGHDGWKHPSRLQPRRDRYGNPGGQARRTGRTGRRDSAEGRQLMEPRSPGVADVARVDQLVDENGSPIDVPD